MNVFNNDDFEGDDAVNAGRRRQSITASCDIDDDDDVNTY